MDEKVLARVKEHYKAVEALGYEVVGAFLQGSQNYGLDNEFSDVDTKVIVLPTFEDFLLNRKAVSETHVLPNNEHADYKDIRVMFELFRKQNVQFVEILFSKYMVMNPKYEEFMQPVLEAREKIARYDVNTALNCISGSTMQKYKALEHPYPSLMDKINKFGYDPKQLHHIVRYHQFMCRYIAGEPYAHCLDANDKEYLMMLKRGEISLDGARAMADGYCKSVNTVRLSYFSKHPQVTDESVVELLNSAMTKIFKVRFKEQLLGE